MRGHPKRESRQMPTMFTTRGHSTVAHLPQLRNYTMTNIMYYYSLCVGLISECLGS